MRRFATSALMALFAITALGTVAGSGPTVAQTPEVEVAVVPGTVTVDDRSAGFRRVGNGWRTSIGGYAGHHFWAPAGRSQSRIGIWRVTFDEPGLYRVLAKLPSQHASSRKAVYKVKTQDGWARRVRNQSASRGSWLSLGSHRLAASAEVRLSDKTLDPRGSRRKLAFDAVRFVPLEPPDPPVITRLDVEPRLDRAIVTFGLDAKGPARSEYRQAGTSPWLLGVDEASSRYADHQHVIRGLKPETDYELRVIATNPGGRTISPIVRFGTLAPVPPVISNIDVEARDTRAIIRFSLDVPGPARSDYRVAGATDWLVGAEETSSQYADHRQVIGGLTPETAYELRVMATGDGTRTISDIVRFTTLAPPPPVIKSLEVKPEDTRAIVTFSLAEKGPARSEYRKKGDSGWSLGAEETSSKFADHRQVITGLSPETAYDLRVIATNAAGKTVSDIVPFTTKPRTVACDAGADLQKAIDKARAGDTLIITGTCAGNFVVEKDLTLRGRDGAKLQGPGSGQVLRLGDSVSGSSSKITAEVEQLTIAGGSRGVSVEEGNAATLERLTVRGNSIGVAVDSFSSTIVQGSTVSGNGVGVWNHHAILTVRDTTIRDNDTYGIENGQQGSSRVEDSLVEGNGGRGIWNHNSATQLVRSTVRGNAGGGIWNWDLSYLTVRESRIVDNVTAARGGGIYIVDPWSFASGGVTIEDSVIRGNTAGTLGGGIYREAPGDRGERFRTDVLTRVTISGNTAGKEGGGIFNGGGPLTLTDVTFANNTPDSCIGC